MNVSIPKKLLVLGLAAAVVLPAVPLRADGSAPQAKTEGFDLDLPAALAASGFQLGLDGAVSALDDELSELEFGAGGLADSGEFQIAALRSTPVREIKYSQAMSGQSAGGSTPASGSKPWYKKKKWWIPVVSAIVVGVAVGGGDGDDNIDDEED